MVLCVEAQESSSLTETQSAGPSAHCQGQDVKPANPKADRALIDAVRKSSKGTVNTVPVKRAIAAGADLDAKMQGGRVDCRLWFLTVFVPPGRLGSLGARTRHPGLRLHRAFRGDRQQAGGDSSNRFSLLGRRCGRDLRVQPHLRRPDGDR